jgi:hypothetical protein
MFLLTSPRSGELPRPSSRNSAVRATKPRPSSARRLCAADAVRHRDGPSERFDERRVGVDHLLFAVSGRGELEAWARRFESLGVAHSPIAESNARPGARVLVFRDPDNVQLELFANPAG